MPWRLPPPDRSANRLGPHVAFENHSHSSSLVDPFFVSASSVDGPRERCSIGISRARKERALQQRGPPLPLTARRVYHWRRGIVITKSSGCPRKSSTLTGDTAKFAN